MLPRFEMPGMRLRVASGAVFSPPDIAGLKLWLDADQEAYADNAAVTNFHDQSGVGVDFVEATNSPVFKTGIINGKPVIRFDGSNDRLDGLPFVVPVTGTLLIVFAIKEAVSGRVPIFSARRADATGMVDLYPYDSNFYAGWYSSTSGDSRLVTAASNYTIDVASVSALKWTNATATRLYKNGTSLSNNSAANTYDTSTAASVNLGRDALGSEFAQVDIAEMIIYDTALSDGDRGDVEDYLMQKYAIP